jgi:hypothetical protein
VSNQEEHLRKYEEMLQRAREQGMLSQEQLQMAEAAMRRMHLGEGGVHSFVVPQTSEGAVAPQGGQPVGYPAGYPGMKAPPTTRMPGQPTAMPQGYVDPLYRNALADLQRWLGQYEKYRGQGGFAQLEPIFQAIKQITGR